jgi:hypothetical protein
MAMAGFVYNHDLLLDEADRIAAAAAYPAIFPALDHEPLRRRFARIDDQANRMKATSRRLGILSIALVALALMGASTAHITEHLPGDRLVAGLSTLAGLIGVLIGGFGVMHSARKERWLWHRFHTERLRQFFFQTQVVLAPEIVRAGETGDWREFEASRAAAFRQLELALDGELEAQFDLAVDEDPGAAAASNRWLVRRSSPSPPIEDSAATHQLREAYRHLRLNGQRAFAQHKLRRTGALLPKEPADQLRLLQRVGGGAILLSVLLHLIMAAGILGAWAHAPLTWLHIGALWLAILALAARTFDEGLRPGREIERYRAYRDGARNLLARFDAAPSLAEALEAMRAMEELSYDEMVAFLKSNKEASFAM